MIYLTSDLHFSHQRNFLYEPRGFSSIEEHDAAIIKNWNEIVTPDDEVFVLGDLVMNDSESGIKKLAQLNGQLNIIFGNHDTDRKIGFYEKLSNVTSVGWSALIKSGKWSFYLCHFPTMVDNFEEKHKFYCLHGHTHSKDKFQFIKNCCYNIALDAHDNKPVSIEQIKADLREIRQ